MKKNIYKEYKKKKALEEKYKEEIKINENGTFFKVLFFILEIISRIFSSLFYIGLIILCSIGATYIANRIGIINIF